MWGCRPPVDRGSHGRRQIGAAGADGDAVPPLSRIAQVYIFDKGNSARAAVLGDGRLTPRLGSGWRIWRSSPCADIDNASERSWAADWVLSLLEHEAVVLTPEIKEMVWSALTSLASAPVQERTLTGLSVLLQSNALQVRTCRATPWKGRLGVCWMRPKTGLPWRTCNVSRRKGCCTRRALCFRS